MTSDERINILVVDDSPSKLLAMEAALADLGQNVVTALSGREALRQLLHQEFAVILLDVNMPELDGFETASLIRARRSSADIPIIFVTAFGDDTHAAQGYLLGAVDYILTPVVPEVLRAKVGVFVELFRKNLQIKAQAEQRIALVHEQAARKTAETANRMKDEFLATLSHELRTPLSSILGWVQLLRVEHHDESELSQGLEVIERNARIQAKIIDDLLDVSRIISGKLQLDLQATNLPEVVEAALAAIQPVAESRNIAFVRHFPVELSPMMADGIRLQQGVWNLLSNAVKFSDPGSKVTVAIAQHGAEVEVSVADTGEGIAPEFLAHVFDRFRQADASTTRSHGGLGIGLAIVQQLVEMHGGKARADSAGPGKGATFTIALPMRPVAVAIPAHPDTLAKETQTASHAPSSLAGLRILVVDDERDAREVIERIFRARDAEVFVAGSTSEALDIFEQNRPDLLVSDIGMPGRDGYDLIQNLRLRVNARDLPAVALTAYARPEEQQRAISAGFQVHVAKPVDANTLLSVVATLTGRNHRGLAARESKPGAIV